MRKNFIFALCCLQGLSPLATASEQLGGSSSFEIREIKPDPLQNRRDGSGNLNLLPTTPIVSEEAKKISFVLNEIKLSGNSAIEESELKPLWQSRINTSMTLAEVYELAEKLSSVYQKKDYVLSRVIVPEQTVKNGVVELRAIEGHITKLTTTGYAQNHKLIQAYSENLRKEMPITAKTLERFLLLYNDLGGINSQAYVKPTANAGELELVIDLKERKADVSFGVHNHVSQSLGNYRIDTSYSSGNLLGLLESHYIAMNSSGDNKANTLVYQTTYPILTNGLQATIVFSASKTSPEIAHKQLTENESHFVSLGLNYPIVRSRNYNSYVYGSIELSDSQREARVNQSLQNDESLRSAVVGVRQEFLDNFKGINQVDIAFQQGLSGLGANQEGDAFLSGSMGNGNPQYSKGTLYLARLQYLGENFSMLAAINGQYSKDILLSGQQFAAGGANFLRAYDPAELAGDKGIAAKLEVRYQSNIKGISSTSYLFGDWAEVEQKSAITKSYTIDRAKAVGLGLRFSWQSSLMGYLELAKPIDRVVNAEQNKDSRLFAGLSYRF